MSRDGSASLTSSFQGDMRSTKGPLNENSQSVSRNTDQERLSVFRNTDRSRGKSIY
jgi:hypothetical protein